MKIGIILNYPLQAQIDIGHLDVLLEMYNNLLKMFDEVHVFSLHDNRSYNLNKRIYVHSLPGKGLFGLLQNAFIARRIIREQKIDIVRVLATTKSAFVATLALALMHIPLVLSVHVHRTLYHKQCGTKINPLLNWLAGIWEKLALKRADKVPVISYFIRDYVMGLGADPKKIILHRNFVDLDLFKPKKIKHKGTRLFFSSRLVGAKCVDILIDSMPKILRYDGSIKLWIAGDGPQRTALEEQAKRLGIERNVKFLGYVRHEELPSIMGQCDIFTAAGQAGFVLNEAMACGMPIVAADIEWTKEIITPDVGVLMPFGDSKVFADAVIEMLKKKKEWGKLGENGRRKAEKELSLEAYKQRELKIYREVLNI